MWNNLNALGRATNCEIDLKGVKYVSAWIGTPIEHVCRFVIDDSRLWNTFTKLYILNIISCSITSVN